MTFFQRSVIALSCVASADSTYLIDDEFALLMVRGSINFGNVTAVGTLTGQTAHRPDVAELQFGSVENASKEDPNNVTWSLEPASSWKSPEAWPVWLVALIGGLTSSVTFPVGAALAYLTSEPGHKYFVACWLSFGAGCALFAVTVELYAEALYDVRQDSSIEGFLVVLCIVISALIGAILYQLSVRWLSHMFEMNESSPPAPDARGTPIDTQAASSIKQEESQQKLVSQKDWSVGMQTWYGVFITGIPEGLFLGALAAERKMTLVLVASLLVSNFPTAFASSRLLMGAGRPAKEVVGLWTFLCLLTGLLAAVMAYLLPGGPLPMHFQIINGIIEGFAAGGMLQMIAGVMLPEAYSVQGDVAGVLTVAGFLFAVCVKLFGVFAVQHMHF